MKKVSKKALNQSFWRWWYGNLTGFTHEHMQTFAYMWAMLPIIGEMYASDEERSAKLVTYYPFFNTEPQIGAIVVGITAGLEEARANGNTDVDDEMINGIRAGLMGPLAGIGDALIVGTYIPILLGISLGFAEGGNIIGPLFYIVVWNATILAFMRFIYFKGYELGGSAVEVIVGEQANAVKNAAITLGQIIVGAMAASWVSIRTSIALTAPGEDVPYLVLQNSLDGAFPGLLTLCFVLFCWWLMAKKSLSPVKVMLLMVVIALVGVLLGVFDPGLNY
ncbi:MAG: PTS system mannose/fructose/sorbose family transporter subunit IID [Erysipelotrichaceae bacterium]|jgi:mannose/fructose/N-acetylgalactosamine-specific phosphotransferase system component IID|nr:PTS system mannose/fructose/sorbose family transporter subunit IID [Erysipelotrichaceae bacterium]